jgi:hypothetical protein
LPIAKADKLIESLQLNRSKQSVENKMYTRGQDKQDRIGKIRGRVARMLATLAMLILLWRESTSGLYLCSNPKLTNLEKTQNFKIKYLPNGREYLNSEKKKNRRIRSRKLDKPVFWKIFRSHSGMEKKGGP